MRIEIFQSGLAHSSSPLLDFKLTKVAYSPYNWHEELEVLLVLGGKLELSAGVNDAVLHPGDIEIINVDEVHKLVGDPENSTLSLKINLDLARKLVPGIEQVTFDSLMVAQYHKKETDRFAFGKQLCDFFLFLKERNSASYGTDIDDRLKTFLTFMIDDFDIVNQALMSRTDGQSESQVLMERYRRVTNYIYKNSSNQIGLQEIADRENLSLYFLSHEIKDLFGDGFQMQMNYQRIQNAMKLLLDSDLNLTEIAYESGYSAPRYLSNYFNKLLGTSPLEYRSQYQPERKKKNAGLIVEDIPEARGVSLIKKFLIMSGRSKRRHWIRLAVDARSESATTPANWARFDPGTPPGLITGGGIEIDEAADSMRPALLLLQSVLSPGKSEGPEAGVTLFTLNGFRNPLWYASYALSRLGSEVLIKDPNIFVTRQKRALQLLLYNTPGNPKSTLCDERHFSLAVRNLETSNYVTRHAFNDTTISIVGKWRQLGEPIRLSDELTVSLGKSIRPDLSFDHVSDSAVFEVILPPFSFELITIQPSQ